MPYIGKSPSFGVRNRFVYVASSGATSVSGADANGATLTFTDGAFVDVYLNGVLLKPTTDYNTSTANTIAGLSALNTSDEVTVVVYDVFAVADTVSATSGGAFQGAVDFVSGFTASDGSTITVDDNSDNLTLTSTDADANGGPNLKLYRNSSSPADGDMIGQIDFEGRNDNSQDIVAASIRSVIDDVSDGTEDSRLIFETITGGSAIEPLRFKPGETVFNEGSADIDFRIESNDSANMFVLDGGNNLVTLQNDTDTDYNANQTANNVVLNLKNATSGASNCVGMSFSTEANGEQYITAEQNDGNNASELAFGFRISGSRSEFMRLKDSQLLLGTDETLQSARISIEGNERTHCISLDAGSSGGFIGLRFGNSAVGSINTDGSSTSYVTSSDYRLKENINYSFDATTELKKLKPAKFNFKKDKDTTVMGFLAHEVDEVLPFTVTGTKDETQDLGNTIDEDGKIIRENVLESEMEKDKGQTWTKTKTEDVYQGIDQSKLVPLLVKTIQELEARVTSLESK